MKSNEIRISQNLSNHDVLFLRRIKITKYNLLVVELEMPDFKYNIFYPAMSFFLADIYPVVYLPCVTR